MALLSFETLEFKEKQDEVMVTLLKLAYFKIKKSELETIGPVITEKNVLNFPHTPQEVADKKFNQLLGKNLPHLKNILTDNPVIYLHQNSHIPLIGHVAFGLVYRNTSLIELKPSTSCNLNCIFCSVGEGLQSKKVDFLIEKDYLLQELDKLLQFINHPIEAHIGVNGEPFLYGDLIPLIADLNSHSQIHTVSLDTNGTLLTKNIIDQLSNYPKLRLNLSLHALNPEIAQKVAGCPYNLNKLLDIIKYSENKVEIMLTPLLVPGKNESEMEPLVKFAKENNLQISIQNFLHYKTGRNPAKPWAWPKFYDMLKDLEKKYNLKLIISPETFHIEYTTPLPLPFHKDDEITAKIILPDRFPNSRIATAKNRLISLPNCTLPINKTVKIKLTRDKHNIFSGKVI